MKLLKQISGAAVLVLALAACSSKPTTFSLTFPDDSKNLLLTAENAQKDAMCGSGIDVEKGESLRVSSNLTSGQVDFRLIEEGKEEPTTVCHFDASAESYEFTLDPGSYMVGMTCVKSGTTGTVSVEFMSEGSAPSASGTDSLIGSYSSERCSIDVQAGADNTLNFLVSWGSTATEHTAWTMSGTLDEKTNTVAYDNAVKTDIVHGEDGKEESSTVVYENGKGSFAFHPEDGTLVWNDEEEHTADGMTFGSVTAE